MQLWYSTPRSVSIIRICMTYTSTVTSTQLIRRHSYCKGMCTLWQLQVTDNMMIIIMQPANLIYYISGHWPLLGMQGWFGFHDITHDLLASFSQLFQFGNQYNTWNFISFSLIFTTCVYWTICGSLFMLLAFHDGLKHITKWPTQYLLML